MNRIIYLILVMTLSAVSASHVCAQRNGKPGPDNGNQIMTDMSDKKLNDKLVNSLTKSIPEARSVRVLWSATNFGYAAHYTFENIKHMAIFDGAGNLAEVFAISSWDDRVPEIVRLEFNNSPYNIYDVINFWEGSGARTTHYYLEMQNRAEGTAKNVWCDENGKFSETPF